MKPTEVVSAKLVCNKFSNNNSNSSSFAGDLFFIPHIDTAQAKVFIDPNTFLRLRHEEGMHTNSFVLTSLIFIIILVCLNFYSTGRGWHSWSQWYQGHCGYSRKSNFILFLYQRQIIKLYHDFAVISQIGDYDLE